MKIILKNQKVLIYNEAGQLLTSESHIDLYNNASKTKWIATIPWDAIERIETVNPCNEFRNNFYNELNIPQPIIQTKIKYRTKNKKKGK